MILEPTLISRFKEADMAPHGWKQAGVLHEQQIQAELFAHPARTASELQRLRWESYTGRPDTASGLTLIVPVHNEEKFLPSFLAAVDRMDIPSSVNMKLTFIVNASGDQSAEIIRTFIEESGEKADCRYSGNLYPDPGLSEKSFEAVRDRWILRQIDTQTAGKANALAIGNAAARKDGDAIAVSVDANVFPEPDAVPRLYGLAAKYIEDEPDGSVLFCGRPRPELKPSMYAALIKRFAATMGNTPLNEKDFSGINGWMMAWDTGWFDRVSGQVQVANEDYAMGVVARAEGFHTRRENDARVWGYRANNLKGDLSARARSIRGRMQFLDLNPELGGMIEAEHPAMRPFSSRVGELLSRVVKSPHRFPIQGGNFLLTEYSRFMGIREYQANPGRQSWDPIEGTK